MRVIEIWNGFNPNKIFFHNLIGNKKNLPESFGGFKKKLNLIE